MQRPGREVGRQPHSLAARDGPPPQEARTLFGDASNGLALSTTKTDPETVCAVARATGKEAQMTHVAARR